MPDDWLTYNFCRK